MSAEAAAAPAPAPAPQRPHRPHRVLVPAVLALATVLAFFACFAVWVNRQLLNTDNWTKTSTRIIADQRVQEAVTVYVVGELFSAADVPARLERALPSQVSGLAGPLSAGLREIANREVPRLLATSQVQELWRRTNQTAHAELLRILEGGTKTVSTRNGVVELNLHELITELGAQLGLSSQVAAARSKLSGTSGAATRAAAEQKTGITLPPSSGKIVILRASQLKTAQDIVKAIKGLAIVLPLLALALFAFVVWWSAGWRRRTLRSVGWCLFGVGVALLLLRRVGGNEVVSSLVANPDNKPAAENAWSIATTLLYDIAIAMVLYGLVVVAAAWLAGSTRPARFLRHALAPWLRDHITGSYAAAAGLLLLLVLWGPTPATRQVLPVLGFAALFALGVTVLRHQTEREYPDAVSGEALAGLRRSWAARRSHAPTAAAPTTAAPAPRSDAVPAGAPAAASQEPGTEPNGAPAQDPTEAS